MKNYVRVCVFLGVGVDRRIIHIAEETLEKAFRADGVTLAGKLGKVYREYAGKPGHSIEILHITR